MERLIFPVTKAEAKKKGLKYSSTKNKEAMFPSRLRELRADAGISQEALSKILGCSKSTLGLYETGDTLPDAKTLEAMAAHFVVGADYLLCLSDIKTPNLQLKEICAQTGLTEAALYTLLLYQKTPALEGLNHLLEDPNFMIACNQIGRLVSDTASAREYEHSTPYRFEDFLLRENPDNGVVLYGYDVCEHNFQAFIREFTNNIETLIGLKSLREYVRQKREAGLKQALKETSRPSRDESK